MTAMGQLAARDLRSVLDFVFEARSFPDLDSFRTGILPGLLRLVPSDVVGYNEVDAERGSTVVISHPADAFFEGVEERFARLVHQHPLVARAQAGDRATYTLSDFLTEGAYHRLELYHDMYRHVDAEDQIAFALPGELIVGLALNRPRRSFTRRDRDLLELLRPHLAQAYTQARDRELASALLAATETGLDETGAAVIVLDSHGRIGYAAEAARELLAGYFGAAFERGTGLPPVVVDWLETHDVGYPSEPFVTDGRRGRLCIRHLPPPPALMEPLLLLEEQRPGLRTVPTLQRLGLTRRQAEILRLVAIGKDNDSIAAELFISTRTVRKHLEHIYTRLGVSSRTAAAARAHAAR
jgi:DNA-binding CsgD family transcriptional regulator